MKTKLLAASMLFVLAVAATARAADDDWKEYKPEGGACSILMPKTIEEKVQKLPGGLELHVCRSAIGDVVYTMAFCDLPSAGGVGIPDDIVLDTARDGGIRNTMGKLRSEKKIALKGNSGREVLSDLPNNVANRQRYLMVNNRLYEVMVSGPKGKENAPEADKFFDSFKLLDK